MKNRNTDRWSIIIKTSLGAGIAVIISMALCALLCTGIMSGTIKEDVARYLTCVIQVVAVMVGAVYAGKSSGKGYLIVCGISAAIYFAFLSIMTILLFDTRFDGVGLGVCFCAAGWLAACAICMAGRPKKRRRK